MHQHAWTLPAVEPSPVQRTLQSIQHRLGHLLVEQPEWREDYFDQDNNMPIFKVDSYQLRQDLSLGHRYETATPCTLLVEANQWADNVTAFCLGRLEQAGTTVPSPLIKPAGSIEHPGGLRFYLSLQGKTCDRDITKNIWQAVDEELRVRAASKAQQGLLHRAQQYAFISF